MSELLLWFLGACLIWIFIVGIAALMMLGIGVLIDKYG